ncbi:DUF4167 domain-containing protein [Sphingobium sp. TCM1]|uniref:DUF4167 domain-containing protein n=1 Tax=Sphingobium sp. TCM1 TaxID=453246 RepID=UPI0007F4F88F|nr:DUF4167 domain-containing protein [Sphingobium sp. TCM1]OAN50921.1 Eukaryotic translation initiation factor 3 subunit 10 [Sphingobium sp. TCM1]
MINNRQAGRRNRGRNNNGRPNGNNRGGGDNGNRIDNRARGNAAQLLEKYKNMARDAQMAGDRVNAEYYLQFADHYFRVLADNRARQEEQQQRFRPREENYDEDGEDFDGAYDGGDDFRSEPQPSYDRAPRDQDRRHDRAEESRDNRDSREGRDNREGRDGRNNRRDRNRRDRFAGDENAPVKQDMGLEGPVASPAAEPAPQPVGDAAPVPAAEAEAPRPPRRGRPRKVAAPADAGEAFDAAVLPPSIARADNDAEPAAEAEAPKKRTRRPRAAATTEAAE